ncbi:hypothetical protein Q5P01_016337 [Channa striata]|uniref:Uncharacterized protein n=1 Tax=Channa striata TaxID=64152 RepID=A0AA88MDU3_CHASR|nr:hypothetical protein Q5P01_016337 [Channa striata]
MDVYLKKKLHENSVTFKKSLDRIIEKYSKLQYHDGGIEVDLDNIQTETLEKYMRLSKKDLNKLESKSLSDLREESLKAQDITRNSQLDFIHEDGRVDTSSISQFSGEDYAIAKSNTSQITVSSLDDLQPEDQDEELELTLRSHGSTLVELYPSMISRIGKAWHRRNVSEAADSVLRRYRRWRQRSNRSNLNNTFIDTPRHSTSNPKQMNGKSLLKRNFKMEKKHFTGIESASLSPLRKVTNLQEEEQQQCSGNERGLHQRDKPVLVIDLTGASDPEDILLNETFTVSELTQMGAQSSICSASPSQPRYPTKISLDQSQWSRRLSLSGQSEQASGRSMYAVEERPDVYGSPIRRSPSKARTMTSLRCSPKPLSKSPRQYSLESFSRVTTRPRSMSTSLSSPPQKPCGDVRMLYCQNSNHSLQSQPRSPQSSTAEGRKLCRQLSFDSLQPLSCVSYSPKKLDEDFKKLYHKFVCQNKSFFSNAPPCRHCMGNCETSKSNSSSALAALALSPHRSLLRKRYRELSCNDQPQSKRFREECYTSSPGSKRHSKEMLKRCLSPTELEQAHNLSLISRKRSIFQKVSTKKCSASAPQEAWIRGGLRSSAEMSGLGDRLESSVATSYSPRKW